MANNLAIRGRGDAVGAGAAGRVEHRHRARFGIEAAVYAILPGKPKNSLAIKGLWARIWQGAAFARRGDLHQGVDVMRASVAAAATIEAKLFRPLHLGQLFSPCRRFADVPSATTC
jgi:hypothetical protein